MENKKTVIFLVITAVIIVFLTIIILYNLTRIRNNDRAKLMNIENIEEAILNSAGENEIGNYIVTTNATEEKISPKATIIFHQYYKGCGHTVERKEIIEDAMVNLSREELEDLYKNWDLISFSKDKIELFQEFPGQCGEHYIVKEHEGNILIYKIGSEGDKILMENTEIETQYLPDIDKENLKNGVEIIGKGALNSYLENFE